MRDESLVHSKLPPVGTYVALPWWLWLLASAIAASVVEISDRKYKLDGQKQKQLNTACQRCYRLEPLGVTRG